MIEKTFIRISAYLNLALAKPAWQVGDLSADNTADKAVDGNGRNAPTSLCAHGDAADVRISFARNCVLYQTIVNDLKE